MALRESTTRSWGLPSTAIQILLGLVALLFLSSARIPIPILKAELRTQQMLGLLGVAFIFLVLALIYGERRGRPATTWQVVLVGSMACAPFLFAANLIHPEFSRVALVVGPILALFLAWLIVTMRRHAGWVTGLVAALAVAGVVIYAARATGAFHRAGAFETLHKPTRTVTHVSSARYPLKITSFENYIPPPALTHQGGLTLFRDGYLVATGDGDIYFFRRSEDGERLDVENWPLKVPLNAAEFAAAANNEVNLAWFRVADILAQETPAGFRLFATHHFWKTDQQCWVLRVSTIAGRNEDLTRSAELLRWETLFETKPCVPLQTKHEPKRFQGIENGGRMILVSDDELLVSIGDHGLEAPGYGLKAAAPQDPTVSYGKTILVNLRNGSSEVFSSGHRNPQGLHRGPSGVIWESEHGPEGGDELNRLHRGGNYGWPLATYGVEYGMHRWPLAGSAEQTARMEEPFLSWYPSIGPSNLIEVTSPLFEDWRGDLLLATLRNQTLWRLRVRDDRVVLAEPIRLERHIRDILEGHKGEIVLWTDRPALIFIEPDSDSKSGEALYRMCASCHVSSDRKSSALGPPLKGIVEREVASVPGFEYSRSLKQLGGVWTPERLDGFLANPTGYSPGTSMVIPGIEDPVSRDALIKYLAAPESRLDVAPTVAEFK